MVAAVSSSCSDSGTDSGNGRDSESGRWKWQTGRRRQLALVENRIP